ncbi:hypothetical protein [Puniceibacterium confluentis]|uniref:hypothetical protein n=1 Tax=Puniceibacterium confluentis TaxID=1958944 RepID=UPI0016466438|nr:hypothetical protein [Puniceibacterium confluentis]
MPVDEAGQGKSDARAATYANTLMAGAKDSERSARWCRMKGVERHSEMLGLYIADPASR